MFKSKIMKKVIGIVLALIMMIGVLPANASAGTAKAFEDVKAGYWAKNSIDYVSSLGYINGYGNIFGNSVSIISVFRQKSKVPMLDILWNVV